jgi:hypothetical protein
MKNKNNRSANELVDLIVKLEGKKGSTYGYATATGVLISIMDWSRNSSDKNSLQNEINYQCIRCENELQALTTKDLEKICNSANLEELYA